MNRREFEMEREAIFQRARDLSAIELGACRHCDHFLRGFCGFHQSEVPAEHQVTGCDEWQYDEIPF